MPKGVVIPDEMCETVVRMSDVSSHEEIYAFTNVSKRQQQRIMKEWHQTGTSERPRPQFQLRGRPRLVSAEEAFLSQTMILLDSASELGTSSFSMVVSTNHVMHILMNCKQTLRYSVAVKYLFQLCGELSREVGLK